jgi:hypothetical protein
MDLSNRKAVTRNQIPSSKLGALDEFVELDEREETASNTSNPANSPFLF